MAAVQGQVSIDVIKYLRASPNMGVHYADIAEQVHAEKQSVNNVLTRLVSRRPEMGIRRLGMGQYIFRPELQMVTPEPTPEPSNNGHSFCMYEGIGRTQDGTIIVRDEEGVLYKLAERL